jgi:hypothetical protein
MPGPVGNNQNLYQDGYGHTIPLNGPSMVAGGTAAATGAGTISVNLTGAGTGGSISFATGQTATDMAGTFTVTTSGTPAAGTVAVITYANSQPGLPKAIIANLFDTDGDQNDALGITNITVNGFSVVTDLVLVAAESYNVSYIVVN